MHLDEESLQRFVHGEVTPERESALRAHLADCIACRARLQTAKAVEQEVMAALRLLDHDAPMRRLPARATAVASPALRWRRIAAGAVLVLTTGGLAWAAPRFPFLSFVERLTGVDRAPKPVAAAPATTAPATTAPAGLAVEPGPSLVIEFDGETAGLEVSVALADTSLVSIQALRGRPDFAAAPGRLLVTNHDSASQIAITIPRTAVHVELRLGGQRLYLKRGSRLTSSGQVDDGGRILLRIGDRRAR